MYLIKVNKEIFGYIPNKERVIEELKKLKDIFIKEGEKKEHSLIVKEDYEDKLRVKIYFDDSIFFAPELKWTLIAEQVHEIKK